MKLCLANVENLYLLFDTLPTGDLSHLSEKEWQMLSTSIYENKPLQKCFSLAKAFQDIQADIFMLCEVGGLESLSHFNNLFLKNEYHPCLLEGNSDRQLDIGFLVSKKCSFYFDILTNKHRSIDFLYPHEIGHTQTASHKFSRDVAELRLFTDDKENPFLIILHCHLKSPRDPERIDPNGAERRHAELKTLLKIYQETEAQFPNKPILISGDFNGNASPHETEKEFVEIYKQTALQDSLELMSVSQSDRLTFFQVRNGYQNRGKQIDYCFLNQSLKPYLKNSYVYRYKNHLGKAFEIPNSSAEKARLPSDHYPVIVELTELN